MDKVKAAAAAVGAGLLLFALTKVVAAEPPEGEVKVIKVGVKE